MIYLFWLSYAVGTNNMCLYMLFVGMQLYQCTPSTFFLLLWRGEIDILISGGLSLQVSCASRQGDKVLIFDIGYVSSEPIEVKSLFSFLCYANRLVSCFDIVA